MLHVCRGFVFVILVSLWLIFHIRIRILYFFCLLNFMSSHTCNLYSSTLNLISLLENFIDHLKITSKDFARSHGVAKLFCDAPNIFIPFSLFFRRSVSLDAPAEQVQVREFLLLMLVWANACYIRQTLVRKTIEGPGFRKFEFWAYVDLYIPVFILSDRYNYCSATVDPLQRIQARSH